MALIHQNIKKVITPLYTLLKKHWLSISCLLLIIVLLTTWLSFYIGSAYWTAHKFKKQLLQSDIVHIEQQIPLSLLSPYQAKPLAKHQASKSPGQNYLKHVWPHIIKQQNLYQLLLLQADANRDQSDSLKFVDFPDTIRFTWGKSDKQMWFEWQRSSWRTWQLTQLCFYNPQPLDEPKSCESSKR